MANVRGRSLIYKSTRFTKFDITFDKKKGTNIIQTLYNREKGALLHDI